MADLVKGRARGAVTAERFSQGMTFDQYVTYTGTPENLAREAGWWLGPKRMDFSGLLTLWTSAAVDEILSALHERIVVGSPA